MLLLLRQRVLYAISLQRIFHAEMPSRCCSLILKILHVFAFHDFRASRVCVCVFPLSLRFFLFSVIIPVLLYYPGTMGSQ